MGECSVFYVEETDRFLVRGEGGATTFPLPARRVLDHTKLSAGQLALAAAMPGCWHTFTVGPVR